MAKEKHQTRGEYAEVVEKLKNVVAALESGELSLEDSLDRFGEGIALVKTGEKILAEAEKRIEKLLSDDGTTAPLLPQVNALVPAHSSSAQPNLKTRVPVDAKSRAAESHDEEDVPF